MKYVAFILVILTLNYLMISCQSTNSDPVAQDVDISSIQADEEVEGDYQIKYIFSEKFKEEDKAGLILWVDSVFSAAERTLGTYLFNIDVYFYYNDAQNRAVSFGSTKRGEVEKLNLYVNPSANLDELLDDWIAPHEISHLAIGAIGRDNKWFSEGFATFLSRQINMELGLITQAEFDSIYYHRIMDKKEAYINGETNFIEQSKLLFSNNKYGTVYYGSASYFYIIDKKLFEEKGIRFKDVLVEYQKCCRGNDKNLLETITAFDEIIGENWFTELMKVYRQEPASIVFDMIKEYK